ncbi:MAG: glycosyltransferase [Actinobacteria bacterium]|nr:glycosyltransferase [Actinomycetota bacterium]
MTMLRSLMWGSLGLIAWTHAGYPLAAAAVARVRRYAPRRGEFVPEVALVIAAHNEEAVIEERLRNALRLDYPRERLEIVVASDGSVDRTDSIVERFESEGIRLLRLPRIGKLAAQTAAVEATKGEVIAFSDANSLWQADALRLLTRDLSDPEVGYVCGRVRLEARHGDSLEGLYWRFELWLREQESACGSITAGNGGIYAIPRTAFLRLGPEHSHDLGLPFRLRRRGLRSVYEPAAVACEQAMSTTQAEWPRKVRMFSQAWWEVLRGGMLNPRRQPPLFYAALVSHRLLRYSSGPLHLVLFGATAALARREPAARALLAAQLGFAALALAGRRDHGRVPLARASWYYAVVTASSVAGLVRVLARGPVAAWRPARREE